MQSHNKKHMPHYLATTFDWKSDEGNIEVGLLYFIHITHTMD